MPEGAVDGATASRFVALKGYIKWSRRSESGLGLESDH